MPVYLYCDVTVLSNIILPELERSNTARPALTFTLQDAWQPSTDHPWSHHWLSPSGAKLLSHCIEDSNHWLRFPGLADFRISADATEIVCYPIPATPEETIRHLLLDQVMPRCLAYQGKIMLHASAVRVDRSVILFLGDSGSGKSTLAGNFHQAGNPVVSDDCVWIDEGQGQITAVPSYGGLRLWADSLQMLFSADVDASSMAHYSSKKRLRLHENEVLRSGQAFAILAVMVLSPAGPESGSQVTLERLSKRESFIAILKQTFQLDVMDIERMTSHAQALGQIVARVTAFRLSMPRDYALLPTARQKILETAL